MHKLILHPHTEESMRRSLDGDHQVVALIAPYGAGKSYLAENMAQQWLQDHYKEHHIKRIKPTRGSIGIDDIRQAQVYLKLKMPGQQPVRRIIIIENAQTMTHEAQNALLKTLEEPPHDTRIILTMTLRSAVLPTVYSRVLPLEVLPLSAAQCRELAQELADKHDEASVQRAMLISGGFAGLFVALLEDEQHPIVQAITDAKGFISASGFERLTQVNNLASDRERIELVLFGLKRVLSAVVRSQSQPLQTDTMAHRLKHVYMSEMALAHNPNLKLLMTDLAINL